MSSNTWLTKKSLKDGFYWLVIQVVVGLLPLWGTALLLSIFKQKYGLYDLTSRGEFALYASSFVAGGLYSLRHDFFPIRNWLQIALVLLLIASTLVFVSITVVEIGKGPDWMVVEKALWTCVNLGIFSAATLLCLGITVAEAGNAGLNIPEAMRGDRRKLEAGLDELLKMGGGKE